jgi:2-dehydropantoate 2-reductase
MKICVFGAGAIGGLIGAKLAAAGADEVTLIARGPHLAAIQQNGLTLISEGQRIVTRPFATDDPRAAGPQDVVVFAIKANGLPAIADAVQPLLGPSTTLVPAINGVPWWYFYKLAGPYENRRLETVDPGGILWERLAPERVIGCVVYPAADVTAPGVVEHTYSNRFDIGEPDGSKSERASAFAKAMIKAGFRVPIRPRIRDSLWVKLWGSLSFNMVCVLTTATFEVVARDPGTRGVVRTMMVEAQAVAEKLGVELPLDVDARIAGAEEVGAHKPSTLVDLERGRPMEIDALLGAVVEMGRITGVSMPACEVVYALVRQRGRMAGCYAPPAPPAVPIAQTPLG